MTAMRRPEIVARTLASFNKNLLGIKLKEQVLHLNIDPLPADGRMMEVVEVCGNYFASVHVNPPATPSFPAAVKWCWKQPTTPHFFHLEDDWIMLEQFPIDAVFRAFEVEPVLSCVNLRAYHFAEPDARICLSPGVFRSDHAAIMADRMTTTANPEKQLRPKTHGNPEGDKHGGFVGKCVPYRCILKDIGRPWLERSGYLKNGDVWWTEWVEA